MMLKNVKMPMSVGGGTKSSSLKSALRRGFTIMELVIVIAVIAVLAAVLIPTFANLTERANESADTQTVENLNTILRSEETITGEKPATMAEAIEVAASGGYNVDALTPTSDGNDIVWIKDVNRFALVDGDGAVIHSDDGITSLDDYDVIYKISSDIADLNDTEYGYYFREDTTVSGNITTSVSADFSAVEGVESVTVDESTEGTIDIALNSETADLQVNGSAATVNVYGTLGNINGEDYGMNSLHVYGTVVGKVNVAAGKVVAEAGSSISTVMVTAASYNQGAVSIILEQGSGVAGIGATNENLAGKLNDIVSGDTEKTDIADAVVSSDFAGGIGTEASPYLIANEEQFVNINTLSADMSDGKEYYFALLTDLDLTSVEGLQTEGYNIFVNIFDNSVLDGNGHRIKAESSIIFSRFVNSVLENITIEFSGEDCTIAGWDRVYGSVFENVTTTGTVEFSDRNWGLYVAYAGTGSSASNGEITFVNCMNNVNIYGQGGQTRYNAIFVGYAWGSITLSFENCTNNGLLYCGKAALFLGNQSNQNNHVTLNITNFASNGNVLSFYQRSDYVQNDFIAAAAGTTQTITVDGALRNLNYDLSVNVSQASDQSNISIAYNSENKNFTITLEDESSYNVEYYTISYATYVKWWTLNDDETQYIYSGTQIVYIEETISKEEFENGVYTTELQWLNLATSGKVSEGTVGTLNEYSTVTIDGITYYLIEEPDGVRYNNQSPVVENGEKLPVAVEELEEAIISASRDIDIFGYDSDGHLLVGAYYRVS